MPSENPKSFPGRFDLRDAVPKPSEAGERRRFTVAVCESAHRIADNTFEVSVTKPYVGFVFVPGQSMKFCFGGDPRGRAFSIVSAPHEPYLTFAFRGSDSDLKKNLLRLQAGDRVEMLDAKGDCTYPEEPGVPVVLIAGGIGVAPFVSMLRHAAALGDARDFHLLSANRVPGAAAYKDELDTLARSGSVRLRLRYLATRAGEDERLPDGFERGHISAEHLRPFLATPAIFYAIGTSAMVESTKDLLASLGVPGDRVRFKIFKGYEGVDGS